MNVVVPMSKPFTVLTAILEPFVRLQTYRHFLYLLLAFPLGILYWSILGFGLLAGVLLLVVGIGVGLLLLTVLGSRLGARFERWLTAWLLGIEIPAPSPVSAANGLGDRVRAYIDDPFTWRGMAYLSLKLWIGIIGFILVVALVQALSMVSTLVRYPQTLTFGEVNGEPVVWTVESLPEATAAAVAGGVLAILVVHLTNGFGYVAGRMAQSLLGGPE